MSTATSRAVSGSRFAADAVHGSALGASDRTRTSRSASAVRAGSKGRLSKYARIAGPHGANGSCAVAATTTEWAAPHWWTLTAPGRGPARSFPRACTSIGLHDGASQTAARSPPRDFQMDTAEEGRGRAALLKALADPTRSAGGALRRESAPVCICDFTAAYDRTQPTISHHMAEAPCPRRAWSTPAGGGFSGSLQLRVDLPAGCCALLEGRDAASLSTEARRQKPHAERGASER